MSREMQKHVVRKGQKSMPQATPVTGLTAAQLEQLFQADQIEETMRLLFALNHWAKARERLFFADRQGLYLVKAAILRRAHAAGLVTAKAYIDGKDGFGAELSFELAADIAAEGFLWRLEELADEPDKERENAYERVVHQLYTRITGKACISASEVEALEPAQVHKYILDRLQELEQEARASSRPIPYSRLTELCIAPSDLLTIQDRRYYDLGDWYSWNELDACDLRKLDPEGLSLLALEYISPGAHYVFHLPFRLAEAFVPGEHIARLQSTPWSSRESGEYYGRSVTEAESLQQPIASILDKLGVDIPALCPRQLRNKEDFLIAQDMRHAIWSDFLCDEEDEDETDEESQEELIVYWQNLLKRVRGQHGPEACPCCHLPATTVSPSLARIQHWQQEHSDQDLTVGQAIWVLNCTLDKKVFYQQYPPDYRTPHKDGFGTRYWKLETLRRQVQELEKGEIEV